MVCDVRFDGVYRGLLRSVVWCGAAMCGVVFVMWSFCGGVFCVSCAVVWSGMRWVCFIFVVWWCGVVIGVVRYRRMWRGGVVGCLVMSCGTLLCDVGCVETVCDTMRFKQGAV